MRERSESALSDLLYVILEFNWRNKMNEQDQKDKERMLSIIKAVAHIGVDFGYGKYELEQEYIDMARAICEQEDI